jgi:hypothetical protein
LFHQFGDRAHLGPIGVVGLQGGNLGREGSAVSEAGGGRYERRADCG